MREPELRRAPPPAGAAALQRPPAAGRPDRLPARMAAALAAAPGRAARAGAGAAGRGGPHLRRAGDRPLPAARPGLLVPRNLAAYLQRLAETLAELHAASPPAAALD